MVNKWKHKKRGTIYEEVGRAKLQVAGTWDLTGGLSAMTQMVVYRGEDGQLWVRPEVEFEDGRFEPVLE